MLETNAIKAEKKKGSPKDYLGKLGPLLALIVLVILVSIVNPSFIAPTNLLNLLRQVSTNALIAFGMTFVIITGGIDLSVGSTLALSSALMAGTIAAGMDPLLAMILSLVVGTVFGAVNGLLITKGNMAPFIATLATMTIYRGLTLVYTNGNPITGIGDSFIFKFVGRGYLFGIPFPVVLMIVSFILLYILLHKMTFGRKTFAIGGNEKASFIAGIKNDRIKIGIYALSGLMASLAGIIITSRLDSAQPTAGTSYEMDAIASVVLGGTSLSGGRGRLVGTLIGALIIGTLNNGMNLLGISSFYQQVVKGIVIIIAVLLDRKNKK
ncbi:MULTISPECIES: ABC transporter permease [Carnobacterium]|uniref:ABC transporter permease n=1 Tax=Carnobacterium TaxID=2747 RepID=UPI00204035D0|nr:ribose ABC transporter permease [Carnobacterium inhibens]MCM3511334.1 ribose ABC transporter permease [Carnobacterium inhibens]